MSSGPACPRFTLPRHPDEFHGGDWHSTKDCPIVDGKYEDPDTGEICEAEAYRRSGPPCVDIVIMNLDISSLDHLVRASRALPLRTYLCHLMRVVDERKLGLDSLTATAYTIRLVLRHEFTSLDEWREVSRQLVDGFRPSEGKALV